MLSPPQPKRPTHIPDYADVYEPDRERAFLAVATHLARIERQRPLANIPNGAERQQAESVRKWFKEELINADLA